MAARVHQGANEMVSIPPPIGGEGWGRGRGRGAEGTPPPAHPPSLLRAAYEVKRPRGVKAAGMERRRGEEGEERATWLRGAGPC